MKRFKTKISFKKVNWKKLRFKWYKDYSILTKMLVGFLFVTLLAGTVGVFGMNIIERMNRSNNEMFNKLNAPMQYMTYLYEHYYKMRIATTKGVMSENADYIVYQMSTANTERDQVNAVLESLEGTWLEEDRPAVDKFKASLSDVYTKIDEILANVNNDRHEAAIETLNSIDTERAFTSVEQGLRTLISLKINKAKEQLAINEKGYTNDKSLMITILGISLLLSVLIGIYISFIISVPIKSLIKAANRLADGEVDVSVKANTRDEVGKLTEAFSRMINNIKEQAFAAEKIANGDLDIGVTPKSEKDVLSNSMLLVISTLKKLLSEIGYLINELKNENFAAASDVEPFFGAYREIISGVNSAVNAVREKMFWYEAMLDSIPFPVTVTDLGMNLTFVNKAGEEIMNSARDELLGKKCGDCWNSSICGTPGCAMVKLNKNETRTMFDRDDKNYQVDSAFLANSAGEKIGHIEVVQDVTARCRVLAFQQNEVSKLTENLKLLAEGSLNLNLSVDAGDEYTVEEHRIFSEINENVATAVASISNYIKDISHILNEMSAGNLNVSVMSEYKGDFVEIKESLNSIINSFNTIINEINSLADQVAAGSRQVSEGSQALSQGAAEQASSIEELTASIAHVASQTRQNAANAGKANELANKAKDNAVSGDEQMKDMLTSMEEINNAYNKIAKIIKIIDEIAFQTNILALNASVEAARAGQHGKGFAVVAEEVRNLAIRSADAAKDTETLIENSLTIVDDGTKKATITSESLKNIVKSIGEASNIVDEIATASEEQANAIAQINRGIEQVSKVVQSNSSTAEEGAAASEELSCHANNLRELVGRFETDSTIAEETKANEAKEPEPRAKPARKKADRMIKIELSDDEFGKY